MYIDSSSSAAAVPLLRRYIVVVILLFPVFIALAGALGKILIRGSGIAKKDFYLGQDLTLAAISVALVNVFDMAKDVQPPPDQGLKLFLTAGYAFVTFFLFICIMVLHQIWEKRDNQPSRQVFWLGIVSNVIGLVLLIVFMLMKLRDAV